jgi:putative ABC transport system permease protein
MWRRFFRRHASNSDLEEELQAHLAIEARQLMDSGHSREQAEAQARRQLGSQALVMELTRDAWGWATLGRFWQDIRYSARVLRREPAFTVAAVLSLALGIAAATAVFSIADTVYLRPLPYADADRLVWLGVSFPSVHGEFLPSPDYVAWRRDNRVFQQLAATQAGVGGSMILGGSNPAEVHVVRVSANFLDALAVTPALGRTFTAPEELPNGPRAVLLTYRFWRDYFHARRDIVGSPITLDAQPWTVIGVLPPGFVYPADVKLDVLVTLPISPTASHRDRNMGAFGVVGRLKPGVTLQQARADIDLLYAASKKDLPEFFRADNPLVLQPLREHREGNVHTLLLVLLGAAACLLAIACANVANLLLARWSARAQELAVRAAIGAGRGRLARQLFTEIALLIAAGTAVAMVLVAVALRSFVRFAARELPRLSEVSIDFRVFGIALIVALTTAFVFGALPALRTSRIDLQSVLQQASRAGASGGYRLARHALVAVEMALSVVLLLGATLLFETLWHMRNDNLGFLPEHVLTVSIPLRDRSTDNSARESLARDILTYLRRMPGTAAAAFTQCTPLETGISMTTFSRSDRPLPEPFHRGDNINVCGAGPDYLNAAGTRLLKGRFFTEHDSRQSSTLAVINESAAQAYFPGESAIGKQILGGRGGDWKTVIGVVADSKNQGLNRPAAPEAFVNDTGPAGGADLLFLVRTLAGEDFVTRALRDGLRANHPGLFTKIETLDQAIGELSASPRFDTVLLSTFAAIAFLMAIVGVYGVLAFSVAQRRQEIGVRMALGATPGDVLTLVMKEGAVLVTVGALTGVGVSLLLTRSLATLLYGVTPYDPSTYAVVIAGLALTAAAAGFLPARKAASLDPAATLRHE